MRNIIVTVVLLALFVFGGIFFESRVNELSEEFISRIEDCKTREEIEQIAEDWNERSHVADLIIDHKEIDTLNQYFWSMQVEIESNTDDFEKSRLLAIESLKHIAERNRLSVENIM